MRIGTYPGTAALILLLALTACTGPDLTAVPTKALAPFVCDGVPSDGSRKILGADVVQDGTDGTWGRKGSGFHCAVERADGGGGVVTVEEWDVRTKTGLNAEDALRAIAAENAKAVKIDVDAEGAGYVSGTSDSGSATWVCGDRILAVDLLRVEVKGRDQRADAEAFLVSMLPWACGGETPPKQTTDS